jgi:hypothetical protein
LIDGLLSSGAEVIFFEPRMSLRFHPQKAAVLNRRFENSPITFGATNVMSWNKLLKQLSLHPNFKIVSQDIPLLEAAGSSRHEFNGHTKSEHLLYRDINHLTDTGANVIFRYVEDALGVKKTDSIIS